MPCRKRGGISIVGFLVQKLSFHYWIARESINIVYRQCVSNNPRSPPAGQCLTQDHWQDMSFLPCFFGLPRNVLLLTHFGSPRASPGMQHLSFSSYRSAETPKDPTVARKGFRKVTDVRPHHSELHFSQESFRNFFFALVHSDLCCLRLCCVGLLLRLVLTTWNRYLSCGSHSTDTPEKRK